VVDPDQLELETAAAPRVRVARPRETKQAPAREAPDWLKAAQTKQDPTAAEAPTTLPTTVPTEPDGPSPDMEPADLSPDSNDMPAEPSTGAVQAALDSVLPAARQCVTDGTPLNVRITFQGSTGQVLSVLVPSTADQQIAACVRNALGQATVDRFAKLTLTVPITVSP
jgi:hypothetical protein